MYRKYSACPPPFDADTQEAPYTSSSLLMNYMSRIPFFFLFFFLLLFFCSGVEVRDKGRNGRGIRRFFGTTVCGHGDCFRLARTVRRNGRRLSSSDNTVCIPSGGVASSIISVYTRSPTPPSHRADRSGLSVCSVDVFFSFFFSYFLFFRRREPESDSEPNKIDFFFAFDANADDARKSYSPHCIGEKKNVLPATNI